MIQHEAALRALSSSPGHIGISVRREEEQLCIEIHDTGRRGKTVTMTSKGKKTLTDAFPYWQEAQAKFTGLVGTTAWSKLCQQLAKTTTAARG